MDFSGRQIIVETPYAESEAGIPVVRESWHARLLQQLSLHGLIGCLSAFLLGSVEFIDASLRISPYLNSSMQRLVLFMYFGLGPAVGLLIGLYAGLYFVTR